MYEKCNLLVVSHKDSDIKAYLNSGSNAEFISNLNHLVSITDNMSTDNTQGIVDSVSGKCFPVGDDVEIVACATENITLGQWLNYCENPTAPYFDDSYSKKFLSEMIVLEAEVLYAIKGVRVKDNEVFVQINAHDSDTANRMRMFDKSLKYMVWLPAHLFKD